MVSPYMLYHNAKIYDEWEGADYEGSSCRGAMKGWHKHGACADSLWERNAKRQSDDWRQDAARRPLGAYYRVDAKSVADLQAAIFEVRSVYCSADVHDGWSKPSIHALAEGIRIKTIMPRAKVTGGHAFALVGYTIDGFIVQNSWGSDWGTHGFGLLTYEDWVKNGYDAWVAAVGAPMSGESPATSGSGGMIIRNFAGNQLGSVRTKAAAANPATPWSDEEAYRHAIVLGNDGKILQRIVGASTPVEALKVVTQDEVVKSGHKNIAIYVHGGLNDEATAIARARRMGPWFTANGIHPLFIVWRTGILESLGQIAQDEVKKYEEQVKSIRSKGVGDIVDAAVNAARNAFDRAFEAAAEKLIGKAVWSQMKQNAGKAADPGGPLALILKSVGVHGSHRVHLLGHSAGSIMIGHMLDVAGRQATATRFASCGLYAPACTVSFAAEKYGKALARSGPLGGARLHIEVLTDAAETQDSVGPYGKSLLYLVSRALEDSHKTPLLGLAIALQKEGKGKEMQFEHGDFVPVFDKWTTAVMKTGRAFVKEHKGPRVKTTSTESILIAHGSFDNDLSVVNASLERMLGKAPAVTIRDLSGF